MAMWVSIVIFVIGFSMKIGYTWAGLRSDARRRRERLAKMTGPSHPDPTVEIDRIVGGTTQQAIDHPHGQ